MTQQGLTILMDRSQTGKTSYLLQEIAAAGAARSQMLLVPEHASHEAERDLCAVCGDGVSRYASAASFRWLAADVLSRTGGVSGTLLDSGGKLLTMYRALQKNIEALKVYRRPSQKASFLEQLLHLDDELRSYRVGFDRLLSTMDALPPPLSEKIHDIALICNAYEAMLTENGRDCRDLTDRLIEALKLPAGQAYFEEMDIYADGFLYFNAREEEILRAMMRSARSLTVTLLGDIERTGGIFDVPQQVRARLLRIAAEEQIPARTIPSPLREQYRGDAALRHLEHGLFGVIRPFPEETEAVTLYCAQTTYDEVEAVASGIRRLVASGTCRYRDILVAARNMPDYEATIENVFERYEIPVFLNRSRDILETPVISLVLSAPEIIAGNWSYDDVFRYLRTAMAGISASDCDILENYVLKWDIRGTLWTKEEPWQAHPDGYGAQVTEESAALLARINAIRDAVRRPILDLDRAMKENRTARGHVEALYRFLMQIQLPEQLRQKTAALRALGEQKMAEEYAQLWKILCDILDQFVFILDTEPMDAREFTRLLKLILSQYSIGTIPAALDRVHVAEITRNDRHAHPFVFLLGANDHVLPAAGTGGGILTDSDRAQLLQNDLRLAPFGIEQMQMEMIHLYAALSQASRAIQISYPITDISGAELRPAFIIGRIRHLFPSVRSAAAPVAAAPLPALEDAGQQGPQSALWQYFLQSGHNAPQLAAMERARRLERGRLSPDAVRTLYGDCIRMSASRMERANECHFAFFMQYGLKVKDRRKAGLDAPEIGSFLHYLLEHTAREAKRRGGFQYLEKEELHALMEGYITKYVEEHLGGLEGKTARFRYLFRRLKKTSYAIIDNVVEELSVSDFVPLAFELSFGEGSTIPEITVSANDTRLSVSGKVDRVDGYLKDGTLYLRVVDYKTGHKKFDLADILHGVNIQLLLYLFTLGHSAPSLFGRDVHQLAAAGAEYLPARDVILAMDRNATEEEIEKKMQKELQRSGIFLNNAEVLEALEHGSTVEPHFLPLSIKKDGSITSGAASAAQLGKLSRYIDRLLDRIAEEMGAGNIDADPNYRSEENNACTYCAFASACHFEEGRGSDRRQYISGVKEDTFWNEIDRICADAPDNNGKEMG